MHLIKGGTSGHDIAFPSATVKIDMAVHVPISPHPTSDWVPDVCVEHLQFQPKDAL